MSAPFSSGLTGPFDGEPGESESASCGTVINTAH
jgi:hypothetical protein